MIVVRLAAFAVAGLLFIAAHLPAQERRPITGEGTEGFRALLAQKGFAPLTKGEELQRADPRRVLIVMFHGADDQGRARPHGLDQLGINLKAFVESGGAFMLATDQPLPDRPPFDLEADFGGSVEKDVIRARTSVMAYQRNREFPFIMRADGAEPNLFVRGTSADPLSGPQARALIVATNRPSFLGPTRSLDTIAVFPKGLWSFSSEVFINSDLPFGQSRLYPGGGRFLLLADHSIFINSMLLPQATPNDNLQFAVNCIDWMKSSGGEARQLVLFLEDGRIWQRSDYDLMLQAMPTPRPEDIAEFLWENRRLLWDNSDLAESLVAQLEEDGIFSDLEKSDPLGNFLAELFDRWMIIRFVAIVGALALLGFGIRALMSAKSRVPQRVPRLSMVLDRMRPRTGLLEWRLRSGIGKGQYYELARERARAVLSDLRIVPGEGGPLPTFTVDAGWWKRNRIARDLRFIWTVAYGADPTPIPAKQWEPFQTKLRQLATMIETGTIRFG